MPLKLLELDLHDYRSVDHVILAQYFVCCPGLAVNPSGKSHLTWRVPNCYQ